MIAVAHASWLVLGKAAARVRNLFSLLRNSFIEARQVRATLETELFHGRYHLSSKNDDDLPIVR